MTLNKIDIEKRHRNGKLIGGILVVLAGLALLLKKSGVLMPNWLFTWQMLLILIGVYIGFKHSFKNQAWWIMSLIGLVFLIDEFVYDWSLKQFFWPIIIIGIGLAMIFGRRKKRWDGSDWKDGFLSSDYDKVNTDDKIETVAIFGSIRKNIISKNFRGGELVSVFGGSEINLSQADIQGPIKLELVNIMGGTKLIIPANWELRSEIVSIFGGIEDKRPQQPDLPNNDKVLFVEGVSLFGGIEIKSY